MTRRYRAELTGLSDAYRAALEADIDPLARVVEAHLYHPLVAIGSGGSFSTASFASQLHEHHTGQIGRATTPLEYLASPGLRAGMICFTSSGRNRDIGAAFKIAAQNEGAPLSALVMASDTPMHKLGDRFQYASVVAYPDARFKDGFLAVASLIGSSVLLLRAYAVACGIDDGLPPTLSSLAQSTMKLSSFDEIAEAAVEVTSRTTVSVLYTPSVKAAAVDLESRFVEAALGSLHAADLRNFGHGRHHWIAKRGPETGVLALIGDDMSRLADRTLALLPSTTAIARYDFTGDRPLQLLAGLTTGLHVSEAAGRAAKIDPGKPGVPEFGRKLYRLGPGAPKDRQTAVNLEAALRRKVPRADLADEKNRSEWVAAYEAAIQRFASTVVRGIVFDFDGTLCDGRAKAAPLSTAVADALQDTADAGVRIGIATGRGPSAGEKLRSALPDSLWSQVIIGYYNGSVITTLADDRDPLADALDDDPLLSMLRAEPVLASSEIRPNEFQISVRLRSNADPAPMLACVQRAIAQCGGTEQLITSSHSADIIRQGASKLDVVHELEDELQDIDGEILRIGDMGRWPGNDAALLDSPFGLSVDVASSHRDHCWNLAPAGVRGVQATLHYMNALRPSKKGLRLRIMPGGRG